MAMPITNEVGFDDLGRTVEPEWDSRGPISRRLTRSSICNSEVQTAESAL